MLRGVLVIDGVDVVVGFGVVVDDGRKDVSVVGGAAPIASTV